MVEGCRSPGALRDPDLAKDGKEIECSARAAPCRKLGATGRPNRPPKTLTARTIQLSNCPTTELPNYRTGDYYAYKAHKPLSALLKPAHRDLVRQGYNLY